MLFNSIDFAVFLPIVFFLYWFGCGVSVKAQNALLILSGAVFYGWWDPRYLTLLLFTSGIDMVVALGLERTDRIRSRKALLAVSLVANLGLLGFFKYHDFFAQSFADAFSLFGMRADVRLLHWVLPVGISFYTFQSLSYTIDVYRRELTAVRDPLVFFGFVGFFPQMLAGPIERARNMLPQFALRRTFDVAASVDGCRQMLWGLFKKVVIADQCAPIVDAAFDDPHGATASQLLVGCVFFAFQIYGDFSGYSDIAIGCARLFGFGLMRNFAFPYFSRDIAEFWRRWHISLSTWFRDYLYIPLGGSRGGPAKGVRNTLIIFLVSGLWHGANYTFIIWGAIHALLFLPLLLSGKNRSNTDLVANGRYLPSGKEAWNITRTFIFTTFAWIFFRASDVTNAWDVMNGMFKGFIRDPAQLLHLPVYVASLTPALFIVVMLVAEWMQRSRQHALEQLGKHMGAVPRWSIYFALTLVVLYFTGEEQSFIYFQF